ncbi:MAG: PH domain-containing protein [Ruminococcus sp.]|nr:PH domain-containing protein [Ruminococcus sp.]
MKRQHPLKMLSYSAKNLWLLIFPLLRGLFSIHFGDAKALLDWFAGAWFDILTLLIILFTGYIRWQFSRFNIKDNQIVFSNGVIVRTRKVIPLKSISAVTEEKSFYLRPFKATKVLVNTRAGTLDKDLSLIVNEEVLHWLRMAIGSNDVTTDNSKSFEYKPNFWHTFFFSFIFSSTLTGAIYIFVFLFKAGSIVEQFLQRSVLDEFNLVTETVTDKLMLNVSPIFVGLSLIIAFSWILSFITNIVRYTKFRIKKNSQGVFIRTGVMTKRRYKICENMVNYTDLCQSFWTKIFKFVSINVNCSGYGSSTDEIPVFIPIMSRKNCQNTVSAIMPNMKIYPNNYKPRWTNFWRYTYKAIISCVLVLSIYFISMYFFPDAINIIKFLTLMVELPLMWYLIISIISLFTTGFSLKDNQLCIRYSKGFSFHTILVSDIKIAKVSITQTIFQKFSNTYNITFYLSTEQSHGHKVMGMPKSAIEPFLSI